MPKLIPSEERKPEYRCWFCGTDKSVKHSGRIINPCPYSRNRYLDILICSKCASLHKHHLVEYWKKIRYNLKSQEENEIL